MVEERADTLSPPGTIRLRPTVRQIPLADGHSILYAPGSAPVRVTAAAKEIWPMLVTGARLDELAGRLSLLHPKARDSRERLEIFLSQLRSSGLLEDAPVKNTTRAKRKVRMLFDLDVLAARLARMVSWLPNPFWILITTVAAGMAVIGAWLLLVSSAKPRFFDAFTHFSVLGFIAVLTVVIPLHEIGHALACRLSCVRVGFLGLRRGLLGLPLPFVETPEMFLVANRWKRFQVSAAGLFSDLLLGGAAAWIVLWSGTGSLLGNAARFVFLYCLMTLNVGTSPMQAGDGSNMLSALLNDDFVRPAALLRQASRFSTKTHVWIYWSACIAHLVFTGALVWYLR
jgi:hypothetical protein